MNPTYHEPQAVVLAPIKTQSSASFPNTFNLGLRYRPEGAMQWFVGTYVPESLQHALVEGDVSGLHLETLQINSPTQRRLPGQPDYLVLGVTRKNGARLSEVPLGLLQAKHLRNAAGIGVCAFGALLMVTPHAWAGALALVLGSYLLHTARHIPSSPFLVLRKCC